MKTYLHLLLTFSTPVLLCTSSIAQTTVADGNWSNPATWGGVPPIGSGAVVINHNVTLDVDYGHTAGSVTINSAGTLNGNSPMRSFALNYPGGTATLTVNGILTVSRVFLASSTVTNNGTFQSDSLLNSATFTNNGSAMINANQFMINTSGVLNNAGTVNAVNFLNIASVINSGAIFSNDFCNSKNFTNSNAGTITLANDFSNIDTLTSPAIFSNDGIVAVANDWHNGNQINGSGKFCIWNNTWNSGTMTGTFDFCDQTGGNIDLNTGTVAGTITFCVNPCSVGIDGLPVNVLIQAFPNPFSLQAVLNSGIPLKDATISMFNCFGQTVREIKNVSGQAITLYRDNLPGGLYFVRLTQNNQITGTVRLIITD